MNGYVRVKAECKLINCRLPCLFTRVYRYVSIVSFMSPSFAAFAGVIVDFVSFPVMKAFTAAAAFTIAMSQIKVALTLILMIKYVTIVTLLLSFYT